MSKGKVTIHFSWIDCKNYRAAYFTSIYENEVEDKRPKNVRKLERVMEVDYLKRVKQAQEDITREYEEILELLENGTDLNLPSLDSRLAPIELWNLCDL